MGDYAVESCTVKDPNVAEQIRCLQLIANGGAVDVATARRDFPRSAAISVVRKEYEVVGVASVKPLRTKYATGIARKAKFPFAPETPELGYVVVDDEHRGKRLSSRMAAALAKDGGAMLDTTSDAKMKSALKGAGFEQRGCEWKGRRGNAISLWIRS